MKDHELVELLESLDGHLDQELPNTGHEHRFLRKLEQQYNSNDNRSFSLSVKNTLIGVSAIAALLLLFFSLNFGYTASGSVDDLADVSSEMAETQSYFTLAINEELEKIKGNRRPETQKLINDAMLQLQILEKDYNELRNDLNSSGDDERVIYAMITNFQNRVELLKGVLSHINQINEQNLNTNDENSII